MMAMDFFDEEYERQEQKNRSDNNGSNGWYDHPAPESTKRSGKPLYIVLVCLALVLCIGFGWLMCWIVQSVSSSTPDKGEDILNTVIDYMQRYYYKDISDEQWLQAIEASGTTLMQTTGDQYSRLLSPQAHYDMNFPSVTATSGKVFGVSFLVEEGIGMYVSSVVADSPAFGKVKEGDIVLKLSDMRDENGNAPVVAGITFSEMMLGQWSSDSISLVLAATDSANFHILREDPTDESGFTTLSVHLQRGIIPVVNTSYDFQFIEFYFGRELTNVSTAVNKPLGASTSTEEQRHLDELPADTGYIRITEFMYYSDNGVITSAADEFARAMELFDQKELKHLVLDLRGNPGGRVDYAADILAKLVTTAKLNDAQKQVVLNGDKLVITYLDMPKPSRQVEYYYRTSQYADYFGQPGDICDIAVWTDGNSASASELVTGCLRDYGTAVQMGVTTYGKGIAQNVIDLPFSGTVRTANGTTTYPWAFYYTCASYYSPLGINIHGTGYTPDEAFDGLTSYEQLVNAVNSYWG